MLKNKFIIIAIAFMFATYVLVSVSGMFSHFEILNGSANLNNPLVHCNPTFETSCDASSNGARIKDAKPLQNLVDNNNEKEQKTGLLKVLRDKSLTDMARNEAANSLQRENAAQLPFVLLTMIDDEGEKPRFRAFIIQYLGNLLLAKHNSDDCFQIVARLRLALDDHNIEVRREALLALVRIRDPRATLLVEQFLTSSNAYNHEMKDLAIHCAEMLDLRNCIPAVRVFSNDQDESIRIAAINALSAWYDDESRPAFEEAAKSKSIRIQRAGQAATVRLDSLERLLPKKEQTVEKLSEMLKDDRLIIRNQAAMALARFGGEIQPAMPSLTSALKRVDSSCKTAQIVAYLDPIRKAGLSANSAAETIVQLMDERSPVFKERPKLEVYRLRAYMLLTLADIGAARTSVKFIAESLANSDAEMTFNFAVAAHAAGTLGADAYEFTPLLERALQTDFVDVPLTLVSYFAPLTPTTTTSGRIEAIRALAKIGPGANDAVPMLKSVDSYRLKGTKFLRGSRRSKSFASNNSYFLQELRAIMKTVVFIW